MICKIGKSLAEIENFLKEKYIQEMVLGVLWTFILPPLQGDICSTGYAKVDSIIPDFGRYCQIILRATSRV